MTNTAMTLQQAIEAAYAADAMALEHGARGPYLGVFLDNSHSQEMAGYPKAREALMGWSDAKLEKERRLELKATFSSMFGHNAKKVLALIEAEIAARQALVP